MHPCIPASLHPCIPASLHPCIPASLHPSIKRCGDQLCVVSLCIAQNRPGRGITCMANIRCCFIAGSHCTSSDIIHTSHAMVWDVNKSRVSFYSHISSCSAFTTATACFRTAAYQHRIYIFSPGCLHTSVLTIV